MGTKFDCNYGEEEFKTVEAGIDAIKAVLFGDDIHAKERLLYYLDWYMDPYYKKDLSEMANPLKELLQKIVVTENEVGIIEEAFHLLEAYTEGPYEILRKNLGRVPKAYQPTALFLLNSDNVL